MIAGEPLGFILTEPAFKTQHGQKQSQWWRLKAHEPAFKWYAIFTYTLLQDFLLGYCVMSLDNKIGMDPTGIMPFPPAVQLRFKTVTQTIVVLQTTQAVSVHP
ncbi:hypothetical protein [Pseudogracilibacillus sp. SO30301A]|uniref:hypothetical protein n=1 Tax=Pseudogracilibacillus sp. SO30301A TaxID=3098291 RepID=UPI00300E24F7